MSQRHDRTSIAYLSSASCLPHADAIDPSPSPDPESLHRLHIGSDAHHNCSSSFSLGSEATTNPTGAKNDNASATKEATSRKAQRSAEKRRKRKTIRACNHCQKSHLTCDDSRPCLRCVKRGIAGSCVDGVRKKAKYLIDAETPSLGTQKKPTVPPLSKASAGTRATNGGATQPAPIEDLSLAVRPTAKSFSTQQ
ncbi:Transcriptional regulator of nonfermentable carbon utilization, partial [Coemansia sp. Benny D160-2]